MTDTDLEQRLRDLRQADMPPSSTRPPIDTAASWREFQALRSRSVTTRRRSLVVAVIAAAAAIVIAFPAFTRPSNGRAPQPRVGNTIPATPHTYPNAVAARIPLSGVLDVVGDAGHVWVVRSSGVPGETGNYQLVGIELRTNSIMFRKSLGRSYPAMAGGDGRLWLTTGGGQADGQIVRVDLATGKVLSTVHLHAGPCTDLAFSSGRLFAACAPPTGAGTELWRIEALTERANRLTGRLLGGVSAPVATPDALWYARFGTIIGLVDLSGRPHSVLVRGKQYVAVPGSQALVYGDGSIWVLRGQERLARINPNTGQVIQTYGYRNYDPRRAGGLDFMTAGGGWLWFLDNGYPFSGVLRVRESTGRPAGGVRIPPNSCGQVVCSQIYYTPGSVWVPTAQLLIRIATSRMPY
jgi:hypothetical protein